LIDIRNMGRHSSSHKLKLKRGLWSPEEDEKLARYVTEHGHGCWSAVPKLAGMSSTAPPTGTSMLALASGFVL
jgi:hypothetical protein